MRRPAAAVLGTIAGAALLLGAKLGTRPPTDLGVEVTSPPGDYAADRPAAPSPPTSPRSSAPSETATTEPESSADPPTDTTSPPTAPEPTEGSGLPTGSFDGVAVTHKYGTLQVTITVAGGTMTNVTATYSTTNPVSEKLNAEALPTLREEALAAQSTQIDTVSGATYTSDAYRSSLQSALDEAGD